MPIASATRRPHRRVGAGLTVLALLLCALATTGLWSVVKAIGASASPVSRTGWVVAASVSNGGEPPSNMVDGNTATRWSTGTAMSSGQSVTVDMGTAHSIDEITMDSGSSAGDFARGYQLFLSSDGSSWGSAVAAGNGSAALVDVTFTAEAARYFKVVQTGSAGNWWSIAELNAYAASDTNSPTPTPTAAVSRTGWVVAASVSNGGEPPSNMVDGNTATRWSTGTAMSSGQSVTVDMGTAHSIDEITMDSGSSAGDFARGYQLFLSSDGSSWGSAVAAGNGSAALVDVTFTAEAARYFKVVQTGSAGNWWSIAELNAYAASDTTSPTPTPTATSPAPPAAWLGAWAPALAGYGNGINNQTVRMVVHTSLPGTSVRIRLSNQYGANPLPIGAVDIAVQSSGANAVVGTRHVVTFGGSPTTTVGVNADLVSDPIDMTVTAEENLLVSVYFSGNAGTSSWHWDAQEVTYYSASGDFASDEAGSNYPASDHSWYYLDGLDVSSSSANGTVVAFGDSITDGALSTLSDNNRWPNYLARRLQAQPNGPRLGVVDAGIGGNRLLTDTGNQFGTSALRRFTHDALAVPGVKDVILLEGINDIGSGIGPNGTLTTQEMINGYQTIIAQAHAANVKIFAATILPFQGAAYYSSTGETIREAVNNWILSSGAFDGVFDTAVALESSDNHLQLNAAYDSGDHLHPNDAGYQALAGAVDLSKL